MIRITGGINRSRLLETPESELTKPTMDKVRLGVFSALGISVNNAKVLDLFAGSGSYGFEALSRGAKSATFVDKSLFAKKVLENNKTSLKENNAEIVYADVVTYLNECKETFDIVFVDPPYKLDIYDEVVDLLIKKNIVSKKGIIVLESERELNINQSEFESVRFYKYSLAKIYILRK